LLPQIDHLIVHLSKFNDLKIKIQKLKSQELPSPYHLFSYIKKTDETQREKEERKNKRDNNNRNKNQNPIISNLNGHNF
jgi:hypothetical protein